MKINYLIIIQLFGLIVHSYAGNDWVGDSTRTRRYPSPQINEKLLFYVQRTHNRNTIIYELNLKADGKIDTKEPLHPLWIRYEEGGIRKELSYLQNRVYGLNVRMLDRETWLLNFRQYSKRTIYLIKSKKTKCYKAMITINGKMATLTSLFICSVNNALGIPSKVNYIDITGIDPVSGAVVNERVIP
jgi:hypothetical protein